MKESALVQKIIKAVKAKYPNIYVRKLADRHTRGLPDIVIVVQCSVWIRQWNDKWAGILFVETKTDKGKPSKLQEKEIESIWRNGGEAIIARDVETVLAKLEGMGAVA